MRPHKPLSRPLSLRSGVGHENPPPCTQDGQKAQADAEASEEEEIG